MIQTNYNPDLLSCLANLSNDEGNAAAIDEPIKDFPLVHFLKLGEDE